VGDAIAAGVDAIKQAPGGGDAQSDASDSGSSDETTSDNSDSSETGSTRSDQSDSSDTGNATEKIPGRIVLMSDGFANSGRSNTEGIELAKAADVPVSTIAFGTDDGVLDDPSAAEPIPVPVDRKALEEIADETGGTFSEAASEEELAKVFADIGSQIGFERETRDIAEWFTGAALVALLACGAMSLAWFSRLP
jgi:Ca-activated chloride channel family protein